MKAVILAGGLGTRISEESKYKPKPLIEIIDKPILWHIMKIYSYHGINEFIICLGYKGHKVKEYFSSYFNNNSDYTVDLANNSYELLKPPLEDWKVTLVDTGLDTMTGGRVKRLYEHLKGEEDFCLTYGDGVADVDLTKLIDFHKEHGKIGTLTATLPPEQFGILNIADDNLVSAFNEKPVQDDKYINGGFFVFKPKVLEYISGDAMPLERDPLAKLAKENELMAYKHNGFWQCMDTLRDKNKLEKLYEEGSAPWVKW